MDNYDLEELENIMIDGVATVEIKKQKSCLILYRGREKGVI